MTTEQKRTQVQGALGKLAGFTRGSQLARERQALGMVERFKAWRKKNGLSQRQAAAVMERDGVPIGIKALQGWEQGRYRPSRLAVAALERFLAENAAVTDAPRYGKRSKFSEADLAEIRRLRAERATIASIGERFGVDQSYISRILSAERLAKVAD